MTKHFWILCILFWLHRAFTFSALAQDITLNFQNAYLYFLGGAFSDVWVAFLMFILVHLMNFFLVHGYFLVTQKSLHIRREFLLPEIIIALGLFFHQSYVNFFHIPIIPFHLTYLFDLHFLKANASSILNIPAVIFLLLCTYFIISSNLKLKRGLRRISFKKKFGKIALLCLFSLICHMLNIRYNVNWFLPEPMKYNVLESITYHVASHPRTSSFSKAEFDLLAKNLHMPFSVLEETISLSAEKSELQRLLFPPPLPSSARIEDYRTAWKKLVDEGKKPLALAYVMESFRCLDAGACTGENLRGQSLTPFFDELAQESILFTNMYSTGDVTRGGQEAIWCGFPGSVLHSTMRNHREIKLSCLPDLSEGHNFWLHGGEGLFDSQEDFWKSHKVSTLMSQKDFPPESAKTGWGIGDITFVKDAIQKIQTMHREENTPYFLGMLLSVSNHIPWKLPSDAPPDLFENFSKKLHPSAYTTIYADHALGKLVAGLKQNGLWEQTLLIVIGDHGRDLDPLVEVSHIPSSSERMSNIAMLLTGGISPSKREGVQSERNIISSEPISQMDIASFFAYVLGIKNFAGMGEPLFSEPRRAPVVSDFGDKIYFPQSKEEAQLSDLFKEKNLEANPNHLYYASMLRLLNLWNIDSTPSSLMRESLVE